MTLCQKGATLSSLVSYKLRFHTMKLRFQSGGNIYSLTHHSVDSSSSMEVHVWKTLAWMCGLNTHRTFTSETTIHIMCERVIVDLFKLFQHP